MEMKRLAIILCALLLALPSAFAQDAGTVRKLNKKNLVIKEWNTNAKGAAKTLDHMTIYSPEGKKIEETEYDSAGNQKWRKRYEWGENGRMARELVYDDHNRLVNFKKFEYNEFGKKKIQYNYDSKGKLTGTKIFEYLSEDA